MVSPFTAARSAGGIQTGEDLYEGTKVVGHIGRFTQKLLNYLDAISEEHDIAEVESNKLSDHVAAKRTEFESSEAADQVTKMANYVWTLPRHECALKGKEICSCVNRTVREDDPAQLKHLLPLIRSMNSELVVRGKKDTPWPKDNISFRGIGMPAEHLAFFTKGKEYRVNMFLATSFSQQKAGEFAMDNSAASKKAVLFHVHFHPILRCQHVNLIESVTAVKGENEFLFPPYSAFSVKAPPREEDGFLTIIEIDAFPDNQTAADDLPICPWH